MVNCTLRMSVIAKLNFTRPSPFLTVILDPFTLILYIFVHKITKVRKGLGLVKFSFAITEIRNVQWKVRKNTFAQNEMITVFTAQGKRFKVESLMVNADKMQAFLTDHVEENKIKRM